MEAKVAMDIAQVDETSEFNLNGISNNVAGSRRTEVDLNEAPFKIKDEHLNRLRALSRTGMHILQLIFLSEIICYLIIIIRFILKIWNHFVPEWLYHLNLLKYQIFTMCSGTREALLPPLLSCAKQDHGQRRLSRDNSAGE